MPVRHKLIKGVELIPLNTSEQVKLDTDIYEKCIMCREEIPYGEKTKEHIFPQWLLDKYDLWMETMTLPNGSIIKYKNWTVPCCKTCNNGIMSEWEKIIQNGTNEGFDEFQNISPNIIVWWLLKIYYSKLVKETQLRYDIKNSSSKKMIEESQLKGYDALYMYMSDLIKGIDFESPVPYELYIFKTEKQEVFDYIDDIVTNTIYMRLNDIIIVCALDNYGVFSVQYSRELEILRKLDKVHPVQAMELFAKIVYFKWHYKFNTEHKYYIDERGCHFTSNILDLEQVREFDTEVLFNILISIFSQYGIDVSNFRYEKDTMVSVINKNMYE